MSFKHQCMLPSYMPCGIRTCYLSSFINKDSESLMELRAELENLSPVTDSQIAHSCRSQMDLAFNVPVDLRRSDESNSAINSIQKKGMTCNFSGHPS